jgi:EAL domain-containing protein (putative c-di-GMP-specific phosphodiesterase class I)
MSVNVSGHQLSSAGFVASVAAVVETTRFDPRLLTLEVTESISVGERAIGVLKDLKSIGVKLALDDFGTGNSSLSDIARCPVDIIKIDRSFVAGLGRDPASDSIVGAIVGLAHDLGMTVVAEGVETARQYDLLTILDCDCCQGFYFARPIATGRLDALAHQNNPLTLRSRRSVVEWEPSLNASGQ